MTILLTGATGFIGGAIAENLQQRGLLSSTRFTVRASSRDEGLERLRRNFRRFQIDGAALAALQPAQVILYDLTDTEVPDLGSPEVVINCAALATFSNHPRLWETNVEGVVRFASALTGRPSLKRFIQLGTAMSCGGRDHSRLVQATWDVPPRGEHAVPYTYSKGMAELALRDCPGLPLVVARPSIVVGHSRLGCRPSGSIFWLFRIVALLQAFTCRLEDRIDLLSADDCAEGIVRLALQPTLNHALYHVSAGDPQASNIGQVYAGMRGARDPDAIARELAAYEHLTSVDEKALARRFIALSGEGNLRLVARAIHLYAKFGKMDYVFDNSALVADTGFQPRPFASYLEQCLANSGEESILEQMRWDYK